MCVPRCRARVRTHLTISYISVGRHDSAPFPHIHPQTSPFIMRCDVEPSNPMKPRNRAREDVKPEDNDFDSLLPNAKYHCPWFKSSLSSPPPTQRDPSLQTPPSTASSKYEDPSSRPGSVHSQTRSKARRPSVRASPQAGPKLAKRSFEQDDDNDAPAPATKRRQKSSSECPKTWLLDKWIDITCPTISADRRGRQEY